MEAKRLFFAGVRVGLILTLIVIILGAYVRLSDAGLGCPDWPGCYGRLLAPTLPQTVEQANLDFPERLVEVDKAWKEMIHRYAAGMLGLLVLFLAVLAWRRRRAAEQPVVLPLILLALIVFQSALGMWTVTLQLKPIIVMAHLLGGFTTLVLLWFLVLQTGRSKRAERAEVDPEERMRHRRASRMLPWMVAASVLLVGQIGLGGWTSSNYAALACPDFPQCHGEWWPDADFGEGFVLWRGLDTDYEFGVLDVEARVAIHLTHRIGAVLTLLALGILALLLLRQGNRRLRVLAAVMLSLLLVQIGLGIASVMLSLPLLVVVAHNAVAALLLLSTLTLVHALAQPLPGRVEQRPAARPASLAGQADFGRG